MEGKKIIFYERNSCWKQSKYGIQIDSYVFIVLFLFPQYSFLYHPINVKRKHKIIWAKSDICFSIFWQKNIKVKIITFPQFRMKLNIHDMRCKKMKIKYGIFEFKLCHFFRSYFIFNLFSGFTKIHFCSNFMKTWFVLIHMKFCGVSVKNLPKVFPWECLF